MNIPTDNPGYTAYALGELDAQNRDAVKREMENNPSLRKQIEEIRTVGAALEKALAIEPAPQLDDAGREAVLKAARGKTRGMLMPFNTWTLRAVCSAAAVLIVALIGIRHFNQPHGAANELSPVAIDLPAEPIDRPTVANANDTVPLERMQKSLHTEAPGRPLMRAASRDRSMGLEAFDARAATADADMIAEMDERPSGHSRNLRAASPAALAEPTVSDTEKLVLESAGFAADMYNQLAGQSDGNLFFSPYSILSALSMAYAGARENTAAEMAAALRLPLGQDALPPVFRELNRRLVNAARESGQKLNIANGLCLTGGDVDAKYKQLLKKYYDAEIFTGDLDVINAWVNRNTEGLIPKILEELPRDSVCVLLNAIYFKGNWHSQFQERNTRNQTFHLSPAERTTAPLMNQTGPFKLLERQDFQAIALPYRNEKLSMIVLLPRKTDGLAELETRLNALNLAQWRQELNRQRPREVNLYLPKFELETSYDLVPACRRLGMRDAFARRTADFSGMGWPAGELWISQIAHKAFVNVNEEGTEAAAATAVGFRTTSLPPPPPVFRADRPFIFLIQDNDTGGILFMGRVADPTKKD